VWRWNIYEHFIGTKIALPVVRSTNKILQALPSSLPRVLCRRAVGLGLVPVDRSIYGRVGTKGYPFVGHARDLAQGYKRRTLSLVGNIFFLKSFQNKQKVLFIVNLHNNNTLFDHCNKKNHWRKHQKNLFYVFHFFSLRQSWRLSTKGLAWSKPSFLIWHLGK
jgi:hypothetical protein